MSAALDTLTASERALGRFKREFEENSVRIQSHPIQSNHILSHPITSKRTFNHHI